MARSHLCVGGPHSGRYISIREPADYFRVPIRQPISTVDMPADQTMPSVAFVEYREQKWYGDSGEVVLWVPSTQTAKDTMTILLNCYAKHGEMK